MIATFAKALLAFVFFTVSQAALAQEKACADFNQFSHGTMLPPELKVDDLKVFTFPSTPIRIYDPASDTGPKGAVGAMTSHVIVFDSGDSVFQFVRIKYVSYHPNRTLIKIFDFKGKLVDFEYLPSTPQNSVLTYVSRKGLKGVVRLTLDNPFGETVISQICFTAK